MNTPDDVSHVIKTLLKLRAQIILCVETLNEILEHNEDLKQRLENFPNYEVNLGQSCFTIVSNHSIILMCSFLDEYEGYFNTHYLKNTDSSRILKIRNKNKPGLDRIKKWKDLKSFRNYFAVHNFRIKGKSFFSEDVGNITMKIPYTLSELTLFAGILNMICLNILDEFSEIAQTIDIEENMLNKLLIPEEHIDAGKELTELKNKMM